MLHHQHDWKHYTMEGFGGIHLHWTASKQRDSRWMASACGSVIYSSKHVYICVCVKQSYNAII